MTAAIAPVPCRAPRAGSAGLRTAARLLGVELRRNVMPWILPLIVALFWFDSYRPSTGAAPLYGMRTYWNMGEGHAINDFAPFVAGVAAWMGSRDGRRRVSDLVATASRPRWGAQLATWAATATWAVTAYLACVGVMFAWYARQGVGGTPPWWWVAVGVTGVIALSAVGFAIGTYWPSRFAAAGAAFIAILAMFLSAQIGFKHTSGWALILPTNYNGNFDGNAQVDSGIFYPWLPDVAADLAPVLAEVAGLPGAPARAGQVAASYPADADGPPLVLSLGGHPTVLSMALGQLNMPGPCGFCNPVSTQEFADQMRYLFARAFVGAGLGPGSQVQQAVQAALLLDAGMPLSAQAVVTQNLPGPPPGAASPAVDAAALRFAAQPAAARNAWLVAHLAALRAGGLTLGQLP
jgi:hypothetical protein